MPIAEALGTFGLASFTILVTAGLYAVMGVVPGMQLGLLLGSLTQIFLVIAGLVHFGLRLIENEYRLRR